MRGAASAAHQIAANDHHIRAHRSDVGDDGLEGGEICIRTSTQDGRLVIEVEDNGVGIPEERLRQVYAEGIGMSNVHERLRVLYGGHFRMEITSRAGQGTLVRIEVPEVISAVPAPAG